MEEVVRFKIMEAEMPTREKLSSKNPEIFIEENFLKSEKNVENKGLRYKLVIFEPKNEEIKEWAKSRIPYLFCGNGNTAADKTVPPEKEGEYAQESFSNARKLRAKLEENPHEVITKTEEAINSINGFLKAIGKDNLAGYYTSTISGENGAYAAKKMMENGEDMEDKTVKILNQENRGIWITSQLSPYTPYISKIFLRKDISGMEEWREEFDKSFNTLVGKDRLDFIKLSLSEKEAIEKAKIGTLETGGVDSVRSLHALAYSKQNDLYQPVIIDHDDLSNMDITRPISENSNAFSLMKIREKNIYSGRASIGWQIPEKGKMSDITDFAMVTGKEFYENGIFKFMIIKH